MVNDPDNEEPVTLGLVRDRLREALGIEGDEEGRLHFGNEQSLYAETEALIEEYGEEALAIDFLAVKASDTLSEIIEAVVDDSEADTAVTLGGVREAITGGRVARLIGEGIVDPDEDGTLLAEIDALIKRYGEDTPAEGVLRFE
jgi:hypothetical protein